MIWLKDIFRFLNWWGVGLLACVPQWLRLGLSGGGKARLLLEPLDAGLRLAAIDRRGMVISEQSILPGNFGPEILASFAALAPARAPVVLQLPASDFYFRELDLPQAATARVENVLVLDLERRTPFRNTDILQAHAVQAIAGGKLRVRQTILRKAVLDDRLAAIGLGRTSIQAASFAPQAGQASLFPEISLAGLQPASGSKSGPWLAGLALVLAVAVLATRAAKGENALEQIAALTKKQSAEATAVRRAIADYEASATRAASLRSRKADTPGVVGIIEEITRIMPNSSWLSELRIDERTASLSGYSPQSTDLIGLLDQSPLFSQASLVGSITQDPIENKERFVISLQVKGAARTSANAGN